MRQETVSVTVLVDNHAQEGLVSEHGLSLWIEGGGRRILFDTGQGKAFEPNVQALGIPLDDTDILVLSHGHYDHTGSLPYALSRAVTAAVYCHPAVRLTRYAVEKNKARSIGIPARSLRALDAVPAARLHSVEGPVMLSETIGATGPIPRRTTYEDTGGPFYLDPDATEADLLEDDLALWIRTAVGPVVCLGCAHSGVVNTLDHVRSITGESAVRAVIGGFHLVNADADRLAKTIEALRALDIPLIVPCHCTGDEAFKALAQALGPSVSPGAAGVTFRF